MKRYTIITMEPIDNCYVFTGKYLRERETTNWHYYQTNKGDIMHFRKEHMVSVREETL